MGGIGMVLDIAKGAIQAQEYGMTVTGHNIANVNSPSYSRQVVPHSPMKPALLGGFLFGRGVEVQQIIRQSNEVLESRLMDKQGVLAKLEVSDSHMNIVEKLFSTDIDSSLNNLLPKFWNSWHDLSNNPTGASERSGVYEAGAYVAERFNSLNADLVDIESELSFEIGAVIESINLIAEEIAELNHDIISLEINKRTANDLRDQRNAKLAELSQIMNIGTFEQDRGDITVTVGNGSILVNNREASTLDYYGGQVRYETSSGGYIDITDNITEGQIGGWLNMREEVINLYRTELDVLAKEFIWTVNLQHSQGVGLNYLSSPQSGLYSTDASGRFDTLEFGSKIDYTKDFKMWIQDNAPSTPEYTAVEVDMGISGATATSWAGLANATSSKYVFTVTEGGQSGQQINVTETDGVGMGLARTGTDITTALNSAIAAQTITVTDSSSLTQTVSVADIGADAERTVPSIVTALNNLTGVTAYASDTTATLDITNILGGTGGTHENDLVRFTFSSGGKTSSVSFAIGVDDAATRTNFQDAMRGGVADINGSGADLLVSFNSAGDIATITSTGGENIGVEDFDVEDRVVVTLATFQNLGVTSQVNIDNFTNFSSGEEVTFSVNTARGSVNVDYTITDDTDQTTLATDLTTALNAAGLASIGITGVVNNGTSVSITGDTTTAYIDIQVEYANADLDESFDVTAGTNTSQYPTGSGNTLLFDNEGNILQFAGDNEATFTVNGTDNITVDLRRVDTTLQADIATAFYNGLNGNITNAAVTNLGSSISIAATSEFASFSFTAGVETSGADASFLATANQPVVASDTLIFNNADSAIFAGIGNITAQIAFDSETVNLTESGGAGDESGVKTGTVTVFLDPGYTIESSVAGTGILGGLFNKAADTVTAFDLGDSIITLGGNGGFSGFDAGDIISFSVDGNAVSYLVGAADTDVEHATALAGLIGTALGAPIGTPSAAYTVVQNDASISIMKRDATSPTISITAFADDDGSTLGNSATLAARTGKGIGTSFPLNTAPATTLSSTNTSATSLAYGSEGEISWAIVNSSGTSTGAIGTIDVETIGPYTVDGTLNFALNSGDLVAGNTFSINTDSTGAPDLLSLTATGNANSVLDTYVFRVTTGGEIGTDQVVMEWSNSITSGTATLPGGSAYVYPTENDGIIDGMALLFTGGTLMAGDEFTITTDSSGSPTINLPSQWHWTIDSFADQLNRQSPGVTASVNSDNTLLLAANSTDLVLSDFGYVNTQYPASTDPGFDKDNTTVSIDDVSQLPALGTNFRLERSNGDWLWVDPAAAPSYTVSFSALDDLNLDNGFYVNVDNNRAFTVTFDTAISNDGYMEFDITQATGNYSFAFSDDEAQDSGITAALGINTLFDGSNAGSIKLNSLMDNKSLIAAAKIDADSGEFGVGDSRNAIDIADLQNVTSDIPLWIFTRGEDSVSSNVNATIDGYYQTLVGTIGINVQTISSSRSFSENMVNEITKQRDAISAVSVDEEMINIIKFQHAYSVASKLLSVVDEMLQTLVSSR